MSQTNPQPAENRLTSGDRPTSWLVTYDMADSFYKLQSDVQYDLQTTDGAHAVCLALECKWKAAFTTTDIKKGWILLNVRSQAEAEQVIQGYPTRPYLDNLRYTRVYNATQAGINLQIVLRGIKEWLQTRFR